MALLGLGLCGVVAALKWPSSRPALDCPPEQVRWGESGVATCAAGPDGPVPPGQAMTLRRKLDLNRATAEELALVSGIGPALAGTLVRERLAHGGFSTWEEVDALPGFGASKLTALQQAFELRPPAPAADGGPSP